MPPFKPGLPNAQSDQPGRRRHQYAAGHPMPLSGTVHLHSFCSQVSLRYWLLATLIRGSMQRAQWALRTTTVDWLLSASMGGN
jgi:hypothetical protein